MSFLHPEFLWLAPLVAVPILIHLLNRVRYRRIRWAAMEFLLATERRAVRRARLRQILLMILRTAVLLFALGALAQPILSGALASLLGSASQVAVALDASASMSAADASGSAFERAKRLAAAEVAALPRGTRAAAFAFAARTDGAFRVPIQDHRAIASAITSAELTGGATDIPLAIRTAAESLRRGGGGGTIWLLTDLRDAGWHAGGKGAWDDVRAALQAAGHPRIVITDAAPAIASNTSVAKVQVTPDVLLEGDVPRLTAAISLEGGSGTTVKASLSFDGRLVDTRTVQFTGPGAAEAVFHLPALPSGPHAGYVELEHDALPADDRSYFVLRPAPSIPVLIASGQVSSIPFGSSGDFLAAALEPPTSEDAARSPFTVKAVPVAQLAGCTLADFAAVCLADVARPDGETIKALRDYLAAGGLVILFPGPHTDTAAWNASGLVDLRLESALQAEG
ncbi:MAG TPA: BatA domain-containing protein, partial [Phycisphaerae bacterium]|nr:BatA domain-containing protein [Phycisphaerae bacterium]